MTVMPRQARMEARVTRNSPPERQPRDGELPASGQRVHLRAAEAEALAGRGNVHGSGQRKDLFRAGPLIAIRSVQETGVVIQPGVRVHQYDSDWVQHCLPARRCQLPCLIVPRILDQC